MLVLDTLTLLRFFTFVGALFTSNQLFRFARFIWVYCLRPSSIKNYLHGDAPYALVTGASDGIGKALAGELYENGFNVILHGRSEEKTKKVVEELVARGKGRDVRYILASANAADTDFEKLVEPFKDLNVTFVVNNVGGGNNRFQRMDGYSEADLLADLRVNMLFAFYLTRALLPTLRRAAPAQVLFIGSQGAEIRIPRLYTYAPAKYFLKQLARCLSCDERWWTPTRVSFAYVTGILEMRDGYKEKDYSIDKKAV
ncbi:hypothetical protein EIP91_009202 [Steccherinum ochraceum]|uniref:Uncharacterized protein n=1 Tax=Steccherinum ochraceum TaxID=92696 RepID=A0A4R0RJY8_9APHY|nr:hypothetical protein EIP91_009202 [Steccherinum ochraceum]